MIRKHGKACWGYDCRACGYSSAGYPDQFRALEDCQRHERSLDHALSSIGAAWEPIWDTFARSFGWKP
jgi:hypothetical protein